jgi:tRNA dimethylallyltransferase
MEPVLVALVGPTGVGKSDAGIALAKALSEAGHPAEIVNADAMALYRGLDIGTAKLPLLERQGIPHHLLDVWSVEKEASVADYQEAARAVCEDCWARGVIPILVGGSGLYVSSVLYDFDFPGTDPQVRERLEKRLQSEGVEVLAAELAEKDPEAAAAIDPRNSRRVVRALEVVEITGKPFGAGLAARSRLWCRNTIVVGLQRERSALSASLDRRVVAMWEGGLVEELQRLLDGPEELGPTASQAIGYRQVISYLRGGLTRDEAVTETQSLTRRYARRQMSWFRRDPQVVWWSVDEEGARERLVAHVVAQLTESATATSN